MKTRFRLKFVFLFIGALLFAQNLLAVAGGESSSGTRGGGDPQATEFLEALKEVESYVRRSPLPLTAEEVANVIETVGKIEASMDHSTETGIHFTAETLKDESGAEKFALFTTQPLKIVVNREAWEKGSREFKLRLAALELFGLAQVKDRYKKAGGLKVAIADDIKRIVSSAWDMIGIDHYENSVELSLPYAPGLSGVDSQWRPIIISHDAVSQITLDVICAVFGFGESQAVRYLSITPERTTVEMKLFDTSGSMTSFKTQNQDMSKYRMIQSISCRLRR